MTKRTNEDKNKSRRIGCPNTSIIKEQMSLLETAIETIKKKPANLVAIKKLTTKINHWIP